MRAVNLIPKDARRGRGAGARGRFGASHALLGLLAIAVVFTTVYVLESNTVSDRKAKVAALSAQINAEQAQATRLATYEQFEKLAQTRAQTVQEIAATRFDWYSAFTDLSKVVPANTSLQTLAASVAPGAGVSGAGGAAGGSSLRADLSVPALELTGCTRSQDDVARLMSRLRLINGVTRVTLGQSQKQESSQAGTSVSSSASGAGAAGCGANTPSFDLVVFFSPLAGAGPNGAISVGAQPVATTTSSTGVTK